MKKYQTVRSLPVVITLIISLLASPGFSSSSVVLAQPLKQDPVPTEPVVEEPVLQENSPTPTIVLTEIPTEIPIEVPTEIPAEIPTDVPTEEPPTEVPTEFLTEFPTPTPTELLPLGLVETPTATPTSEFTPTALTFTPTITTTPTATPAATEAGLVNSFAIYHELTLADGTSLVGIEIIGPPQPPAGFEAERASVNISGDFSSQSMQTLNVPAYRWVFGCSAVSGAMIAAYYDNNGFPNMYTGPSNGGVMPMVDGMWSNWSDATSTYPNNPLIASKNGVDGRTSRGSIDDYWVQYGSYATDPFITGSWTQHAFGTAIGDYMHTSQSSYGNVDGSTTFYNYSSGSSPLTCDYMASAGLPDGTLGRRSFYQARGYTVSECYNQRTNNLVSGGFSFAQYVAEIQAGHPVMINLAGHTVVGVGYNDASNTVYIHDTWDNNTYQMTWGGSYSGMVMQSVSIVNLTSTMLPAPSLILPANASATNVTMPTFTWNSVSQAAAYKIQVSQDPIFTTNTVDTEITDTVYTPAEPLPSEGIWYWRVAGLTTGGQIGTWSETRYFSYDVTPPEPPELNSPADQSAPLGTPAFTWFASSGAYGYQFEYDDNVDFSNPEFISPDGIDVAGTIITSTSYQPPAILPGIWYYWRVRSVDAAGNWSLEWSAPFRLIVQSSLPVAPVLTSPAAGALINGQPTLAWNSVPTGNTYQVQVSSNSVFSGDLFEDRTKDPGILNHTVVNPLTDGVWYWRVRAINSTMGIGVWSAARSFTYDFTPPAAPVLSLPVDNVAGMRIIPIFYWGAVTNAAAYQYQIDDNADFSSPAFSTPDGLTIPGTPITAVSIQPTGLALVTPYFWHVRARDAVGNWGAWSGSRTITILPLIPAAPVVTSPATAWLTGDTTPTFTWNSVPTGVLFRIQVDNQSTFTSPEVDQTDSGITSFTPPSPIMTDGLYYWRVQAFNAAGEAGAWSTARYLTIDTTPPAAPALSLPVDNVAGMRAIPIFYWGLVTTATAYQYQIDNNTDFSSPAFSTPDGTTVPGTPITAVSVQPTGLALITPYFWHVRARDAAGNWGPWSGSRTITILPLIPTAPVVTSPATTWLTKNTQPSFAWNAVSSGTTYHIQIDNLSTFVSPEVEQLDTGGATTFTPSAPITTDGLYYWRVRAFNAAGEPGVWSAARYFTLDTNPPAAPALSLPADNVAGMRAIPIFYWAAATSATAYQYQIDDSVDYSSPVYSTPDGMTVPGTPIAVTSAQPTGLAVLTPYFWHVRARDAAGNWGPWSGSRTITILPLIPTAPVVKSPATGTLTQNTTPTFTWNPVSTGVTYHIQIDNLSTFVSPEAERTDTSGAMTFTPALPITPDGLYYWRVRAFNTAGEPGAWSTVISITIDTTPPIAPVLSLPADNVAGMRAIPIFYWAVTSTANAYQYQIDDNADYSSPVYSTPDGTTIPGTPIVVTSAQPTGLAVLTPYFWHVRARDAAGNWGPWSGSRTITILPLIPTAPVATSPATGALTQNTTPTFTWNPVSTGVTYHIQIDNQSTFVSPEAERTDTGGATTFTPASPVTPDGLYYWRVRAFNAAGEPGAWSTVRSITIDTTPPIAPLLSLPVNNATGIRAIPIFYWTAAATANAYQYQIDNNADFSTPFFSTPDGTTVPGTPIAVTSAQPTGLTVLTPYYWHVRARDAAGNWGPWSASRSITILPVIPGAPTLVYPPIYGLTSDTTPTLTWLTVSAGVDYQVQVDNLSTFASPEVNATATGGLTSFTLPAPITPDGLYYWRVRAVNAAGEPGAWSTARYFTIDTTPPVAPVLSLPADNAAGIRAIPIFYWAAAATANAYQYQIDNNTDFSSPFFSTPDGAAVPGTPITAASYQPTGLAVLTPYYWHVRARDAAGNWGPWSATRNITILPIIPGAPTVTYPPIYGLTNDTTPTFTWNAVTAGANYQVQVDNLSTFTSPEVDSFSGGTLAFTPSSPITPDGLYYWRVRAVNAAGEAGAWSTVRYFTVDTAPPAVTVLSLPVDNVAGMRIIPFFFWVATATANAYQFQIDDNADYSSPVFSTPDGMAVPGTPITATSVKPTSLVLSTPYYWHVRARDAAGNWGGWSVSRTITILP